jgi:outer membrane protein TolC
MVAVLAAACFQVAAAEIDLPTALRLAGAQNLDVQITQAKLAEARANQEGSIAQFFPWIAPGISYRAHDGKIQDVAGNIIEVDKHAIAPGVAINAQLDIGDALYKSLAARQITHAAAHGAEAQRQDSVFAAVQDYFELALAQNAVGVAQDAAKISSEYERQINIAVGAGLAFKGDALRVRVQSERNQIAVRQAQEHQRIAAARMAQVLRLDPAVELIAQDAELTPLTLIDANSALHPLVAQALAARPELKQGDSLIAAARDAKNGTTYGPLIPTLGAQAFFGSLDGGRDGIGDSSGDQQDYFIGASWRIGPGGLFDFTRINSASARLKLASLGTDKLRDETTRQVVEVFTRWQSLADQLQIVKRMLVAAEEGYQLAKQRKEFAVGVVLETVQAEQDLTRARLDYLKTVAEFNQAQYALRKAIGKL